MARYQQNNSYKQSGDINDSINILTALEISELLKPMSLEVKRPLSERTLRALQEALPQLIDDAEKYRSKNEELEYRRNNSIGVRADRILGGQEGFELYDEEEGPRAAKKSGQISAGMDNMLNSFLHMADSCSKSITDALKTGEMTLFEVERTGRYLGILAQPVVRQGLSGKPQPNMGATDRYMAAANAIDSEYGANEPYVVARRLVDKYSAPDTLDELDGLLKINPVTNKVKDIGFFDKIGTTWDLDTNIRHVTAEGKIQLREMMSSSFPENGIITQKGASLRVAIPSEQDRALLINSIRELPKYTAELMNSQEMQDESFEKFAEAISDMAGFPRRNGWTNKAEHRNALLENLEKIIFLGYRGSNSNMVSGIVREGLERVAEISKPKFAEGESISELTELYIAHTTLRALFQETKNQILENGSRLSYESDRSMEDRNRAEFPFVDSNGNDVNPFKTVHPGKLATLCTELDLALLRLQALPTDFLDMTMGAGLQLANRISAMQERYGKITAETRKGLEDFLGMDTDAATAMIAEAIKDAEIRPDEHGWFMKDDPKNEKNRVIIPDARRILGKALKEAGLSLRSPSDHPDDVLLKAMEIIKGDDSVPVPNPGKQRVCWQDPETGDLLVEPPADPFKESSPSSRFALITGLYVDSSIDSAVPEGKTAYYASRDSHTEKAAADLLNMYGELYSAPNKPEPQMLQKEMYEFISACSKARASLGYGGIDPAEEILITGERNAKEAYVNSWHDTFVALKNSWSLCYRDIDENRKTMVGAYVDAGKDYGNAIIRQLAVQVLERAGLKDDATSIKKGDGRMSEAASYACRQLALSVADTTLKKIADDMDYAEKKNTRNTDWNRWSDLKKLPSSYDTLTKSTVPVFTDESILKSFMARCPHSDELEQAAQLSNNDKLGSEVMNNFIKMIEMEDDAALKASRHIESLYDPDVNEEQAGRLYLAVSTLMFDPEAKDTAIDALSILESNNPDGTDTYETLRNLISSADFEYGSESYTKCMDILEQGRLEHLSPGARLNPYLSKDVLHAKDVIWSAERKAELSVMGSEAEINAGISAETRAKIDVAITAEFSPEVSAVRYLNNFAEHLDAKDLTKGLENSLNGLRRKASTDIDCEILNGFVRIAEKFQAPNPEAVKKMGIDIANAVGAAPDVTMEYGTGIRCPKIYATDEDVPKTLPAKIAQEREELLNMRTKQISLVLDTKKGSNEAKRLRKMYGGISSADIRDSEWEGMFKNTSSNDPYRETIKAIKELCATQRGQEDADKRILDKIGDLRSPDPAVRSRTRHEIEKAFSDIGRRKAR